VPYGGDDGVSFPFTKSNNYPNNSRGALIVRWPGLTKRGSVDRDHNGLAAVQFSNELLSASSTVRIWMPAAMSLLTSMMQLERGVRAPVA
jgi:hypothetical protein